MDLSSTPFKLIFDGQKHLLSKLVASRLNNTPVPINDEGLVSLPKRLAGALDVVADGLKIKEAALKHQAELTEYTEFYPNVSHVHAVAHRALMLTANLLFQFIKPSSIVGSLKVDALAKLVFIPVSLAHLVPFKTGLDTTERNPIPYDPSLSGGCAISKCFPYLVPHHLQLAVSLDSSVAKSYKVGGGARGKFSRPSTAVLVDKLVQVKKLNVTRQDVKDAVQVSAHPTFTPCCFQH